MTENTKGRVATHSNRLKFADFSTAIYAAAAVIEQSTTGK